MSNALVIDLLRRSDERFAKACAAERVRCVEGPSLAAIYFHLVEDVALPPARAVHFGDCPICARATTRVQRREGLRLGLDINVDRNRPVHAATHRVRRWIIGLSSFAVAASILLAVFMVYGWRAQQAFAQLATAVAQHPIDESLLNSLLAITDPAAANKLATELADATQRRDSAVARLAEATAAGDKAAAAKATDDLLWARVDRYRRLRDVARFDDALAECQTAIAEATQRLPNSEWLRWLFIHLDDLGSIYAAQGDYEQARNTYNRSIERRREFVGEPNTAASITEYANSLTPLFGRLSFLSMMQGDYAGAQRSLDDAEAALRGYMDGVLAGSGRPISPSAGPFEAFQALPAEYQRPLESPTPEDERGLDVLAGEHGGFRPASHIIVKLREHYFRVARLRRVEGRYDEASSALQTARAIPYYRNREESRLDFFEPLEAARIAIAQARYDEASTELDTAERQLDQPNFYGRPLGVVARAELEMLNGVALLGKNRNDQQGKQSVMKALEIPRRVGAVLTPSQRDRFIRQFDSWTNLVAKYAS